MKKGLLLGMLAIVLAFGLVLVGCGGKKNTASGKSAAGKALQPYDLLTNADALRKAVVSTLKEQKADLKLWEDTATETAADRAAGHIARGVSNLKVTGPITEEQLEAISTASKNMAEGQLLRLDLSGTTGLTRIPENCFYTASDALRTHLGSIILPEGITEIRTLAFGFQTYLMEAVLPDSLKFLNSASFKGTALAKLVIPAGCRFGSEMPTWIVDSGFSPADNYNIILSSSMDCTIIFKDGMASVNLGPFGDVLQGVSFSHNIYGEINGASGGPTSAIKFVFPPSLKEFDAPYGVGSSVLYELVNEIYSYAPVPPVYSGKTEMFLKDVKTVYVPAEAVAAYEDAWFNITGAEFKPLPASVSVIDKWY